MNCKKCGQEMMIDHEDENGNLYSCVNPQCINYRRVQDGTVAKIENKEK